MSKPVQAQRYLTVAALSFGLGRTTMFDHDHGDQIGYWVLFGALVLAALIAGCLAELDLRSDYEKGKDQGR